MKPAGRTQHIVDRLRHVYIHRAARHRHMPTIRLSEAQMHGVARSVANLNGEPDVNAVLARDSVRLFGIKLIKAA